MKYFLEITYLIHGWVMDGRKQYRPCSYVGELFWLFQILWHHDTFYWRHPPNLDNRVAKGWRFYGSPGWLPGIHFSRQFSPWPSKHRLSDLTVEMGNNVNPAEKKNHGQQVLAIKRRSLKSIFECVKIIYLLGFFLWFFCILRIWMVSGIK